MQLTPQILLHEVAVLEQFEGPILTHWRNQNGSDFIELVQTRTPEGFLVSLTYKVANTSLIEQYLRQEISLRTLISWENKQQVVWKITYQPMFFEVEEIDFNTLEENDGPAVDAYFEPTLAPGY